MPEGTPVQDKIRWINHLIKMVPDPIKAPKQVPGTELLGANI